MAEEQASQADFERAQREITRAFQHDYEELLRGRPNMRPEAADDEAIFGFADRAVHEYLRATAQNPSLPRLSRAQLREVRRSLHSTHGARGPLGEVLEIDDVEDIHVHGTQGGWMEYGDHREPLPLTYGSEEELIQIIRWYAERAGKPFDPGNPIVTFTDRTGTRFNAILPPIAKPLMFTIRRQQPRRFLHPEALAAEGAIPARAVPLLRAAVEAQFNILISGRTGVGKTTVARTLALTIPDGERTCVLETESELMLHDFRDEFFTLEEREPNVEGKGEVSMHDLFVRAALRQRPERIIVGEVRGNEALDLIHAVASGHDGSLTTIHARDPREAVERLRMLLIEADPNLTSTVASYLVGTNIDLIVHLRMFTREEKRVRRLARLCFVDHNVENPALGPIVQEICRYRASGDDWDWEPDALRWGLLPAKIEEKLEMVGKDARALSPQVVRDDVR